MKIMDADVSLKWDNGKTYKIGTVTIEADNEQMKARTSHLRQRIGWELVRKGFKLMFPGRKWRERVEVSGDG